MFSKSADVRRIRNELEDQISRECKKQGRKPNAQKLTEILMRIWTNDALAHEPLSTKELASRLSHINMNDLEDSLAFLRKFPSDNPWLVVEKRPNANKSCGAPSNTYRINPLYRMNTSLKTLSASIILAPADEEPYIE